MKTRFLAPRARSCSVPEVLRNLFKIPYSRDRERVLRGGIIDRRRPDNQFASFSDGVGRKPGLNRDGRVYEIPARHCDCTASTSLPGADAAQIRGDVVVEVVDGKLECSSAQSAVQGVSKRRKRAGVRCTSSSQRRLRRAARENGRFQRDHLQKNNEEGSLHYKNRRLKKGEKHNKNHACISNKV
jgi:hypothetical protein